MIYNYTRCESVIAKIMADLDSTEVKQRTSDIKEWIFEAVEKIGAPTQYIRKEGGTDQFPLLKIEDNQVPLPSDLVALDGVAYSENEKGPWVPMVISTKIFREPVKKQHHEEPHQPMRHKAFTTQAQIFLNGPVVKEHIDQKPEYFIKPGWLVTNKNKGYIKIAYKSLPVDERGYPLIPDSTSYQEAVYWYVTMKLAFSKWMKGTLGGRGVNAGQNMYSFIQQQWNFYRNQAYAEAMMPTAGDIENIKNDWHKLIPDFEGEDRFFDNISDDQQFYNDYYYGH